MSCMIVAKLVLQPIEKYDNATSITHCELVNSFHATKFKCILFLNINLVT